MSDIPSFLQSVLYSSAGAAALVGVSIWLGRSWIEERLKLGIRHEYDKKIAAISAELKQRGDEQVARVKGEIDRRADILRAAASSQGEGLKASMGRRLDAIDKLWSAVLKTRDGTSGVLNHMNILTTEEYLQTDHPTYNSLLSQHDQYSVMQGLLKARDDVETVRPYVGEYAWALFATLVAVLGRAALLVDMGKSDPSRLRWYLDDGIRQHVRAALGEAGLSEFDETKLMKIAWTKDQFELRILAAMESLITGRQLGEAAVAQARRMEALLPGAEQNR